MYENIQFLIDKPSILFPFIIWSLIWKGLALWRAARLRQVGWYVALLVVNTIGAFEIVYLLATNKKYKKTKEN